MAGRFVPASGNTRKSRRSPASADNLATLDLTDPSVLQELLKNLFQRVAVLEANQPPPYEDHEIALSSAGGLGTTVYIPHALRGPVRFWPVYWTGSNDFDVRYNATVSTQDTLALSSYCDGTAIIRVEKAQHAPGT